MEREEKFWLIMFGMAFTTFAITSLGGCAIHSRHTEKMAELGYQKVVLPGSQYTEWQKVGQ
jgi:hypothetical protein